MKEENVQFNPFKCPYCFKEIKHTEVHFLIKAASGFIYYSEEELNYMSEEDRASYYKQLELAAPFKPRETDEQLDAFWNEIGGKSLYSFRDYEDLDVQWDCPVVYPDTAESMTDNGYECDSDGFVTAVTDKYSHHRSEVRLCPYCHNPIPKYYGKYPLHFISVVGTVYSGKTTFLNQLISNREKYFGELGFSIQNSNQEAERYSKIDTAGSWLPSYTRSETLYPPVTITIKKANKFNTLVFYDIFGGNCIDSQKIRKYGNFVINSDGVIVLMDPVQFPQITEKSDSAAFRDVSAVISAMNDAFITDRLDVSGKIDTPFAFVVSKSDVLVNRPTGNPMLRYSIVNRSVSAKNGKVNWNDILKVNKRVKKIINKYEPDSYLTQTIEDEFDNHIFLAVSPLGCDVRFVFTNSHQRVKGNYVKNSFELSEITTVSISLSKRQRTDLRNHIERFDLIHNPKKTRYIRIINNRLVLDAESLNIDSYMSNKVIQLEIDTEHKIVHEMYYEKENSVWKQGACFNIEMRPKYVPHPKRVEEPLHWLLAKFGIAECSEQN